MLSSARTASNGVFTGRREAEPQAPAKVCGTCKERKALIEFPRHRGSKDSHRLHCCACLSAGLYRPATETPAQRLRRAERQGTPAWQRSHGQAVRRYGMQNPLKAAAKRALREAVIAGRVQRSERCQAAGCSSSKAIEGHHWSYAPEHQLDALWVCAAHHRQGHAQGFITPGAGIPAHYGTIPGMTTDTDFSARASIASTDPAATGDHP